MPRRQIVPVLAALVLIVLLGAAPGRGQEQDREEASEVFTGETTVVAVEIPVQVLRRGEPVRGLTAESFVVWEGEERRELSGFEVVDLSLVSGVDPTGDEAAAALGTGDRRPARPARGFEPPPAGRRNFLLFFDLSLTQPRYLPRSIDGARALLEDGLHPSDRVGVAFYSGTQGASLVLQLTSDRRQVAQVLDAFDSFLAGEKRGGVDAGPERGDPLGLTAGGFSYALGQVGQAAGYQSSDFAAELAATAGMGSGVGGFLANNLLSHSAAFMEQAFRERRASQSGALLDNVGGLAKDLRDVPGAKHLVLFSQGYDAGLANPMSNWKPGNPEIGAGGGAHVLTGMKAMVDTLKAAGWVLHGADVAGVRGTLMSPFTEGLFYLSEETGGLLIQNTDDLSTGLDDVLERTAVTYVLTFQAEDVAVDGSFHPIRVELVDGPPSAEVVHRSGYEAPAPRGAEGSIASDPFRRRATAASRLLAGEEVAGLTARIIATSLSFDGGRARVPVLVEVAEPGISAAATEVYVYAFDGEGAVTDFFAQAVDPTADGGGADGPGPGPGEPPLQGLKVAGELTLPPGRYEVRALVRSPDDGREAVRIVALTVPEPDGGPGFLPPVFVQSADERWVVASIGEGAAEEYPFAIEGKRFAPSAAPVLAPGQAARMLVPGLGLVAEPELEIASRVIDAAGAAVAGGSLEILGRRAPAEGQPDLLVARFAAAGLAPGDYALELTLPGTGERVSAPFRVRLE